MNTPKKSAGHAKKPIALPGLVHGLQKINGDFTRYMNYDALINNHLNRHAPTEFAHECVKKAVECEVATWSAILEMGEPATVNGTPIPSADVFAKHAESKADELLQAFGYPALYKTDSPFPWLSSVAYEMDGDQTVLATPLHKSVPRPVMMPMMSPSPAPGGKKKQQEAADMFTFDADF